VWFNNFVKGLKEQKTSGDEISAFLNYSPLVDKFMARMKTLFIIEIGSLTKKQVRGFSFLAVFLFLMRNKSKRDGRGGVS